MARKWNSLTGGMIRVRWTESDLWLYHQQQILAKARKESKLRKMKKALNAILLAAALVLAVAPAATLTGCKTTQQKAVFNTLSAIETSVNAAYRSYLDLVVAGKLPTTSVHAISQDYNIFQALMTQATLVAKGNTNAIAPQTVVDASTHLLNEIIALKGTK